MATSLGVPAAAMVLVLAPIMLRVEGAGGIAPHQKAPLLSLWPIPRAVETSSCGGPVPLSPEFAVVGPQVPRIGRALERLQLPPGPPSTPTSLKELRITLRTPDDGAVPSKTEDES